MSVELGRGRRGARQVRWQTETGMLEPPGRRPRTVPIAGWLLRFAFALFIFSIPFETLGAEGQGTFSVSKMTGYALVLVALLYWRVCFLRPPTPFWYFSLYLALLASFAPWQISIHQSAIVARLLTMVQLLVLFWIASSLLRQERVVLDSLRALGASATLLAVLQFLGITSTASAYGLDERVTALGENLNSAASVFALGILGLMGLVYGRRQRSTRGKWIVWLALPLLAIALSRTGSRGGLLALAVGLLVLMLRRGSAGDRLRNLAIVALALGLVAWTTFASQLNVARWEGTLEDGRFAGREKIFPAAWQMFLEKPFFGWGLVTNFFTLGGRLGLETRDTHNLVLWLLTEVGLAGTIPYLMGVGICVRNAWRGRLGPQGVLPLAMILAVLTINVGLTWHERKLYWVVMALAVASSMQLVRAPTRLHATLPRRFEPVGAAP